MSSFLCQARQNIEDFAATFCRKISRRPESHGLGLIQALGAQSPRLARVARDHVEQNWSTCHIVFFLVFAEIKKLGETIRGWFYGHDG